jgi:hypothetical protein
MPSITPDDLKWAIAAFATRQDVYLKTRNYYHGIQDLSFATPKFKSAFGSLFSSFAYNRCRPVVDAQANKLRVKGFQVSGVDLTGLAIVPEGSQSPTGAGQDQAGAQNDLSSQAMTLWRLASMPLREGELYVEQATTGDAYGVVYFDAAPPLGTGLPRIYPNRADVMRVRYDDDGRITMAVKAWLVTQAGPDLNKRRITFYTPTEIVRLITTGTAQSELPKELGQYTLYKEVNFLGQSVVNPVAHNLGRVPVVHYANNAPMVGDFGISELQDVIPLQDALNKAIADMLVAMEYNAFPQRYAIGIEKPEPNEFGKIVLPWKAGPGEVWYSTAKDAKFGSFEVANLDQFLKVQDNFDLDIARVSSTPIYWLLMSGNFPSGESQKTAAAPFTGKLEDRQKANGASHAEALSMMFQLMGVKDPLLIDTEWESAEPRSQREQAEVGKIMADAGIPLEIVARVMGLDAQDMLIITDAEAQAQAAQDKALAQVQGLQLTSQLNADQQAQDASGTVPTA